jgi:hypothetical protein
VSWLVSIQLVRGLLQLSGCEKLVAEARGTVRETRGRGMSATEAVTRQRLVKTQQTEKT